MAVWDDVENDNNDAVAVHLLKAVHSGDNRASVADKN